ncbi:MAG: hypothetical protein DCC55_15480 [Chloroflexi bacterium]|nr:MAG: hypothetical protein DCC55_15480 [Chloroflexota bacterium]
MRHVSTTSRIPVFSSREEEAAFWDTHDISEFLDELRLVEVKFTFASNSPATSQPQMPEKPSTRVRPHPGEDHASQGKASFHDYSSPIPYPEL